MAALIGNNANVSNFTGQQTQENGGKAFQKSDRALNFNIEMQKEDGSTFNVKLATAWLKLDNEDHADLIAFLDEKPENLKVLFQALADASTYVDVTKKAERKPAFLMKK